MISDVHLVIHYEIFNAATVHKFHNRQLDTPSWNKVKTKLGCHFKSAPKTNLNWKTHVFPTMFINKVWTANGKSTSPKDWSVKFHKDLFFNSFREKWRTKCVGRRNGVNTLHPPLRPLCLGDIIKYKCTSIKVYKQHEIISYKITEKQLVKTP